MGLVVFGVSYRTAPVELRERLAFDEVTATDKLVGIRDEGAFREVALLCTCNRTELYGLSSEGTGEQAARTLFAKLGGVEQIDDAYGYAHLEGAAVSHAMRVASGLDSLCVGERQISGQFKEAFAAARGAGTLGPILDRLFSAALHAAKRVHTETELGTGAVSIASAAVVLAEKVLGRLGGHNVLVVGAGRTGTLAARHLAERKPGRLAITNRTAERAVGLARELGGVAVPLEDLGAQLAEVDVVVCATYAPEPVVTEAMVRAAARARRGRTLVVVDIGMPRNVEPRAAEIDGVFLYPIDALKAVVDLSMARRQREAVRSEVIIADETAQFVSWLRSLGVTPVVRELREHFERVRADEVRRSMKHFPPGEQEQVERLTKALVNKLLHAPSTRLKEVDPASARGLAWVHALRELFALGGSEEGKEVNRGR